MGVQDCVRILLEMGVQDCVRHLVAHLVGVALPHRLGGEKELSSVLCLHHGLLHVAHVGSHPGCVRVRGSRLDVFGLSVVWKRAHKTITNYGWDQSEKFMKIYVTLN